MRTSRTCWRPSATRTGAYALGAVLAGGLALRTERGPADLDGGLPFLVLVGVLLALVALDLWFGEVLCVDADGLSLSHGPTKPERLRWDEVERIAVTSTTSRGVLRLSSLEIDLGSRLVVLSRHRLGADPAQVADVLRSLRAGG